ncbi:hypothetical protein H4W32_002979 [Actinophytocola algeriensis]|uniref:Uncharacterized protein n=1 Tax=Actinophytocola algeriensis TaxID=1768010 RepID=A0A7W7Q7T4_9PSEU|nr:hypothetical protein [Actinophytocola algeriensis]MBE1474937.1 hypothetical protein [Actinophytocola algeriensis]
MQAQGVLAVFQCGSADRGQETAAIAGIGSGQGQSAGRGCENGSVAASPQFPGPLIRT